MQHPGGPEQASPEAGFTLIEALIAVLILVFGLMGVANLFVVATTSNSVANHGTGCVAEATETMERLKAIPYLQLMLAEGGSLDADLPAENMDDDVTTATFNRVRDVEGVSRLRTRWTITRPRAGGLDTLFITVRCESESPMAGFRSRAEFTTFRSCTIQGCPQ